MNAAGSLPASALATRAGLPFVIRLSAGCALVGSGLRCLPALIPYVLETPWLCVAVLHVSSAVN
eukprot:COSAG06_NODE_28175_length_579_cov_0.752083_2_plen_63_part_01